jgi:hypothetical protein
MTQGREMPTRTQTGQPRGRKVLRLQKQPGPEKRKSQTPPAPTPKPTQTEMVALASGEQRSVTIEATNDKEWNDLAALVEGATAISLDQRDITHRTIAAIAALRTSHEDDWKPYCESRGLKWRKEAKSPFQCAVMWVLNRMKAATGENHTSKASMIAGCLDEYWEIQRPLGMLPVEIAGWLDKMGGYTAVYRDRLDRLRAPKDKIAERYDRYLTLPPVEQRDIPDWLDGFDGEVVVSAHINRSTGKIEYRSVWKPEGSSFWYNRLAQFIAARPDYGKAVEPIRPASADTHAQDGDAWQEAHLGADTTAPANSAPADDADEPEPELHDQNNSTVDTSLRARLDRLEVAEDEIAAGCIEVDEAHDEGLEAAAALDCKSPSGCRYSGCAGQRRCLH